MPLHPLEEKLFAILLVSDQFLRKKERAIQLDICLKEMKENNDIPPPSVNVNALSSSDDITLALTTDYGTPLMVAANEGHVACLKKLIEARADVNYIDSNGTNALMVVEDLRCVKLLLEAKAEVNRKNENGKTALIHLAKYANAEDIKMLVQAGAELNCRGNRGTTALIQAVRHFNPEAVQELINAGADIDAQDKDGWTALTWAVYLGSDEDVELLLRAGANFELKDISGETASDIALRRGGNDRIYLLIKNVESSLQQYKIEKQEQRIEREKMISEALCPNAIIKNHWLFFWTKTVQLPPSLMPDPQAVEIIKSYLR